MLKVSNSRKRRWMLETDFRTSIYSVQQWTGVKVFFFNIADKMESVQRGQKWKFELPLVKLINWTDKNITILIIDTLFLSDSTFCYLGMTILMFLTPWMSMVSTIPALQCWHITVEKSISNLYNNKQECLDQYLASMLVWKKPGEVHFSVDHRNTWQFIPSTSIGS